MCYGFTNRAYRYELRNPNASPYNLLTAKHFMEAVTRSCVANKPPPGQVSLYYMLQKWIDFGAGWKRRPGNEKIPSDVSESVYHVITPHFKASRMLMVVVVHRGLA